MKLKSNDLDLRSGRSLCFKINKNLHQNEILGETKNNSISKMKLCSRVDFDRFLQ